MATMIERQVASIQKEVEKLEKSLATHLTRLEKKVQKCEAKNCNWTKEEWYAGKKEVCTDEQWPVYFDMSCERSEVKDIERRLENATARLEKMVGKCETKLSEMAEQEKEEQRCKALENYWISYNSKTPEQRKAEYEAWLAQFKADCLKDGVVIEKATNNYISGLTSKGFTFVFYINEGWTERSLHCYTLRVNGNTIFTSGEFSAGYKYISK